MVENVLNQNNFSFEIREKQARKEDLQRLETELDAQIQLVEEKLRAEVGLVPFQFGNFCLSLQIFF